MLFTISENNLHLVFELEENKPVLFLHMGANPINYTPADDKKDIIREEFKFYREIRSEIPRSIPFWPLGLAKDGDDFMALGLTMPSRTVLAIWHIKGAETVELPLPELKGKEINARIAFPENDTKCEYSWDAKEGILTVKMTEEMARIFEIR